MDIYNMCGIAGIISLNNLMVSKERIIKMINSIAHRGPDGEGCWINEDKNVGFGHRRLAIIDLSENGAQPMALLPGVSPSGSTGQRYTITYNGEIYNYIEIKEELYKKGYRFRSQSDTEIILAAYDYWNKDCLQHFDGMFSFAIWDDKEKNLFAARDRFGEKPFYYYEDQEQFVFGSEMKALWTGGIEKKTDEKMLLNYITLGHVQNANDKEQTFFENIYSLPPAHYLNINFSHFRAQVQTYWDIDKEKSIHISTTAAISKFTDLFTKSVSKRLQRCNGGYQP
ncbi:MAG: asparagine synthase (glutamine-hydrolyzing) [Ferruginibacter sp.]